MDAVTTEQLSMVEVESAATSGARRRFAGWLLIGWSTLAVLWIAAVTLHLPLCPWGQEGCYQGPLLHNRLQVAGAVVIAAAGALALAALWWWDRGRTLPPEPDAQRSAPRRTALWLLIAGSFVGVLAAAHLLLFAPTVDHPFCAVTTRVNGAMAYPLNCDSPLFMKLAHHPRRILLPQEPRQSRPGYVALGAAATRVVGPAAGALGIDRLYGQTDTAYIPLVLINFVVAAAAVALLAWLLGRLGTPRVATVALCSLVAVNDVVKAFYWTPHQQMFALLVPVATIVLARWVMLSRPGWWQLALAGLGAGVASLIYGNVLIAAAVVGLVLLGRGWRGLPLIGLFGVAFAIPQLAWIEICHRYAGSYYNMEASLYHEFVWLPEAAREGPRSLVRWVDTMSITTVRELVSAGGLALMLIACLGAAAVLRGVRLRPDSAEQRAILIAAGLTVACSVAFAWGIGIWATRLMFPAVPALLIGVGWLATRLSASSRPLATATAGALSTVVLGVVVVALSVHGPYG
jgi:hypothetical protein